MVVDKKLETIESIQRTGSPAGMILRILQRQGPSSMKQLEQALGVSTNAVREQLSNLQAAGLVSVGKQHQGAGRPAHVYTLTTKAQHLLPHSYDLLVGLLFDEIMAQDGADKLARLLDGVAQRLAAQVAPPQTAASPIERLHEVEASFARHNMPITVVDDPGELTIHTWSCPYVEIAGDHPMICEMETQMLREVLGQPVELRERIVDGSAGCCFVIKPAADQSKG